MASGSVNLPSKIGATTLTADGDVLIRSSGLPAALPIGTAGQRLTTSNAGLPSWENLVDPSKQLVLYDEFFSQASTNMGQLPWVDTGAGGTGSGPSNSSTNLSGHPGITRQSTGTTTTGGAGMCLGPAATSQGIILGVNPVVFEWCFNLAQLSAVGDEFYLSFGLTDQPTLNTPNNEVAIAYDRLVSGANWQAKLSKAGVHTTTASAVAAATGWNKVKVSATASVVTWTINDVLALTAAASGGDLVNTNIPVVAIKPSMRILKSAGTTACTVDLDYFYLLHRFNTAR